LTNCRGEILGQYNRARSTQAIREAVTCELTY